MTYAEWVAGIAALTVAGVKTKKAFPPQQVNDADLPLSYPRIPELTEEVAALSGGRGLSEARAEMVFLLRPTTLSTNATTFAAALTLIDAVAAAYRAATITWGVDRWSTLQTIEGLDGGATLYWALVATVEGSF